MIKVVPFIYEDLDELYANTYLLIDEEKVCVVIDPGKNYHGLINFINKNNLSLKAVLLTHGHIDHMRGVDLLYQNFHIPVYIGFEDLPNLNDPYLNCSLMLGENLTVSAPCDTLSDKQILSFLKEDINVIHTPYHTAGSMCFYLKDSGLCFTGDFIIPHGVGRSDLPGAKPKEFQRSMMRILALPPQTKIYGGHGHASTLEIERQVNTFVK